MGTNLILGWKPWVQCLINPVFSHWKKNHHKCLGLWPEEWFCVFKSGKTRVLRFLLCGASILKKTGWCYTPCNSFLFPSALCVPLSPSLGYDIMQRKSVLSHSVSSGRAGRCQWVLCLPQHCQSLHVVLAYRAYGRKFRVLVTSRWMVNHILSLG